MMEPISGVILKTVFLVGAIREKAGYRSIVPENLHLVTVLERSWNDKRHFPVNSKIEFPYRN